MTDKQSYAPSITELIHRRAWELMGDGRWYDFEKVVLEIGKVIPPGMALRRAKERRKLSTSRRAGEGRAGWRPPSPSTDELIRYGRRHWVVATLQSRPTSREQVIYEFDPPRTDIAGRNKHNRGEHIAAGRRMRVNGPNMVIRGDLRRQQWRRPVLERTAELMREQRNGKGEQAVRQVAHELGLHLASCPKGCGSPDWEH